MAVGEVTYHMYFDQPLRVEHGSDGTERGLLLNWDTGEFEPAEPRVLLRVASAGSTSDISRIDEDEFVLRTEETRADQLTGDGPVFALYAAVDLLYARKDAERRVFSDEEHEVIRGIRRRTFAMWAAEAERRARGEAPTFTARPKV